MKATTILIPPHTEDWYKFRSTGIDREMAKRLNIPQHHGGTGASEVGILLGQSPYKKTPMHMFNYKVGTMVEERFDSERMFHGRNQEAYIGRLWQCWDNMEANYINNYSKYMAEIEKLALQDVLIIGAEDFEFAINKYTKANDHIIRRAKRKDGYLVHPDYPYLFASLDFISDDNAFCLKDINHKDFQAAAGQIIGQFPVECKTIDKFAAKQFEHDIPAMYVSQLHVQMMLTDSYYGEIAILIGGNEFMVKKYERNDYICNQILRINTAFWEERILPARELFAKYKDTGVEEYLGDIMALEPEPDGNPHYGDLLSERHDSEFERVKGTDKAYDHATKALIYDAIKKEIEDMSMTHKNNTKNEFVRSKCDIMEFGEDGYVKFYAKKGNAKKELYLGGFKVKPSGHYIDEVINKIKKEIE